MQGGSDSVTKHSQRLLKRAGTRGGDPQHLARDAVIVTRAVLDEEHVLVVQPICGFLVVLGDGLGFGVDEVVRRGAEHDAHMLVDDAAIQPEPKHTAQVATRRFMTAKNPDELDEEEQTEQRLANAWRARQGHGGAPLPLFVETPNLIKDTVARRKHGVANEEVSDWAQTWPDSRSQ